MVRDEQVLFSLGDALVPLDNCALDLEEREANGSLPRLRRPAQKTQRTKKGLRASTNAALGFWERRRAAACLRMRFLRVSRIFVLLPA